MEEEVKRLSALVLLAALCVPSIGVTESRDPQSLVQGFVTAWNAHDPAAFEKLFSTDADWVTAPGSRLNGRSAIRDFLAQEHQTWARSTTMTPANLLVRFPTPETAVVFFEWEISGVVDAAGKVAAPSRGNNLFVASRKTGQWMIVAGQVVSHRPRASH